MSSPASLRALKKLIKDSVREAIREERVALYLSLLPKVSAKEQKEIEKLFGSPEDYDESHFKII